MTYHRSMPIGALVAAALALTACSRDPAPAAPVAPPAPSVSTPPANTAAPAPTEPAGSPAPTSIVSADRDLLTLAASAGMLEIEGSRLALEKSKHDQVRNFAQKMVDQHSLANDELRSIARTAGISELPPTMVQAHSWHMERLRALNGQEFDREYAAQIGVESHIEAVELFERAARDASNAELRAFAESKLPALREHLDAAQSVAKAVGVSVERMKSANAKPEQGVLGMGAATGAPPSAGARPEPPPLPAK